MKLPSLVIVITAISLSCLFQATSGVPLKTDPVADHLCWKYGYGYTHTLCLKNSEAFLQMEATTPEEILFLHNHWRGQISDSKKLLPTLRWDKELAVLAERWAAQCVADHDEADMRVLPKLSWIGQNQCFSRNFEVTWSHCINAWASERYYFKYGVGSTNGSDVGHYTQLIWQDTLTVGCAKAKCKDSKWDYFLVCNYGPGGNSGPAGHNHFSEPYVRDAKKAWQAYRLPPYDVAATMPPFMSGTMPGQAPPVVATSTSTSAVHRHKSPNYQIAPPPKQSCCLKGCKYGLRPPNVLCLDDSPNLKTLMESPHDVILAQHNILRRTVSPPPKFPLPKLIWDNDLAIAAERIAAQCKLQDNYGDLTLPAHNGLNASDFQYIGQNLCAKSGADYDWAECLADWAYEANFWMYGVGGEAEEEVVGHYTQMIWGNTKYIGCGKAHCDESADAEYILICHYAPGGNIGADVEEQFGKPYEAIIYRPSSALIKKY